MIVLGKDCVFESFESGQWITYACGRTITLNVQTEFIETSVSGSGKWRTSEPTANSWTGEADGVVNLEPVSMLSLADLRARQYAHQQLRVRYRREDSASNVYTEQGYCYISNSSDTGSFDDVNTFSVSLQGTGPLTQLFTASGNTASLVKRYPQVGSTAPAAGGETTISIPILASKDILGVWKDGVGNNDIILSGTPVGKEVLYDSATGDFTWAIPFEPGENYFIFYQDL